MSTDTTLTENGHHRHNSGAASEGSPQEHSPPASKQHKRTYQACEPCRNRKVRCDLGSVDAPSDPPCLRCRREKKQCYFTETRRKRKAGENGAPELRDFGDARRDSAFDRPYAGRPDYADGMGVYIKPPLQSMMVSKSEQGIEEVSAEVRVKGDAGDEVRNDAAADLFHQPIHQPGDALRLLVDAASRTESLATKRPDAAVMSVTKEEEGASHRPSTTDPPSKASRMEFEDSEQAYAAALSTWARLRYVRAGWFTALEGVSFLEYFSDNLSNLTATPIPNFNDYRTHIKLLEEEPMMTVTLLTIASRYKKLPGTAGASRSIYIHSMLWKECQDMVTRMFWGQEHFGGSFGLASGYRADSGEPVKRGLRALGTVEALLLLSDWHPRSMHFPPAAGNDDILAPLQSEWEEANSIMQSRNPHQGWTEPAMRSDRMSWSLVGAAYNLAVELGVFDSMPECGYFRPGYNTRAYDRDRADRIGRLVHIYVSQTSGRLGYPNMLPHQGTDMNHEFFQLKLQPSENESDPDFNVEQMQRAWCELTAIMRRVNNEIFRSKQQTLELIQSKEYTNLIKSFWPDLKQWLYRVQSIELPAMTRTIVMMEYEYLRTYINSLALQAQIEQYAELANNNPEAANPETNALFSARLVEISKQNAPYIAEVVDATRNLLSHVVDGLQPTGGLKHSPVRISFRILSGAMFLLKTFCLGSKESEIQASWVLLRRTIYALRNTVVDDCHLGLRIADLLQGLLTSVGTKFVRVPINSKTSGSKRHRASLTSKPSKAAVSSSDTKPDSPVLGKNTVQEVPQSRKTSDSDLPFEPPLVNPNDPNIMIMPPPDYVCNLGENPYGQPGSSNAQQGFHPTTFGPSAPNGQAAPRAQAIPSPTLANGGPGGVQASIKFSPTPQNTQPFSPMSNGSSNGAGNGSYDWYAMDINPLLHSNGTGPGGSQANGLGPGVIGWGNMFGPEIGDNLEMLNTLAADQLGFDEGFGPWNS